MLTAARKLSISISPRLSLSTNLCKGLRQTAQRPPLLLHSIRSVQTQTQAQTDAVIQKWMSSPDIASLNPDSDAAHLWQLSTKRYQIVQAEAFEDNYIYLFRDLDTLVGSGVPVSYCVDPGDALAAKSAVRYAGWGSLHFILNTHHHWDHTDGNFELKHSARCKIIGADHGKDRIPGLDISVHADKAYVWPPVSTEVPCAGDMLPVDASGNVKHTNRPTFKVLSTPGHTRDHISYLFFDREQASSPSSSESSSSEEEAEHVLFCGDTLFSVGCGRLFEGTPEEMHASLLRAVEACSLRTLICCAHEYSLANAKFAMTVDKDNPFLQYRLKEVIEARKLRHPTVPTTLAQELLTNPFLRVSRSICERYHSFAPLLKSSGPSAIRKSLGLPDDTPDVAAFAALRTAKDSFRS